MIRNLCIPFLFGTIIFAPGRSAAQEGPHEDFENEIDEAGSTVQLHGFVSQGFLLSFRNQYFGADEKGSFEYFEGGINAIARVGHNVTAGIQLFARDLGDLGNYEPILDWAFIDYHWRDELSFRAGRLKTPFGLYNEFADVDAGRLWAFLPQSVYPTESRNFLIAVNGASLLGRLDLGNAGQLSYQGYVGTGFLEVVPPVTATEVSILTGGRILWETPIEELKLGTSLLYTGVQYAGPLDDATRDALEMGGQLPPGFDGTATLDIEDVVLVAGSVAYENEDWLLAAEYSRWMYSLSSNVPALIPPALAEVDQERFYGMISRRVSEPIQIGAYSSFFFPDAGDRRGRGEQFARAAAARQIDTALALRYDVTPRWIWKAELHYMNGTASVASATTPAKHWGFCALRTTVTF